MAKKWYNLLSMPFQKYNKILIVAATILLASFGYFSQANAAFTCYPPQWAVPDHTNTTNSITWKWQAANNASFYNIKPDGTQHGVGSSVSYTQTGLSPNTAHTAQVKAFCPIPPDNDEYIDSEYNTLISRYTSAAKPSNLSAEGIPWGDLLRV